MDSSTSQEKEASNPPASPRPILSVLSVLCSMWFPSMEVTKSCKRQNGPRKTRARTALSCTMLLLLVLAQNVLLVTGQPAAVEQKEIGMDKLDLESMSDEELEAICTTRGFELYKQLEENTGNMYVFAHEDYVEAARQCLAYEKEM